MDTIPFYPNNSQPLAGKKLGDASFVQAILVCDATGVAITSQAVTGTFFQATQPVSGTVSVSNFPSTQAVSGTLSISNFPASQAVTGTFYQATQPVSGTLTISNFPTSQNNSLTPAGLTVKFAAITASVVGANTIVSAVTSKKIRVLSFAVSAIVAGSLQWKSNTTAISGAIPLTLNANMQLASPYGLFETAAGEALNLVTVGLLANIAGHLSYVEV